ncbi:MAG: GNAT family N-acetyltransferase [Clostridiales bacterium]|nr:GNAT family N-acetyltransferase [Clostridiales bacterium]
MEFLNVKKEYWKEIKEIYLEAFPKHERKPFFVIKNAHRKGKLQVITAIERGKLSGFIMAIPYLDMVMVDYLAISSKVRSKGIGSRLLQEVCQRFSGKKILLLIEQIDENAENYEQRISRKKFYLKNGFSSSDIFTTGASGNMEILYQGTPPSIERYIALQKYALGPILFPLSGIASEKSIFSAC